MSERKQGKRYATVSPFLSDAKQVKPNLARNEKQRFQAYKHRNLTKRCFPSSNMASQAQFLPLCKRQMMFLLLCKQQLIS